MDQTFKAVEIADNVYWVGAVDWDIRNFHGYLTSRGTTYNAFLILADKVTLIDTVKPEFFDQMMERIRSVIDPSRIDYVVSNHSEMDHSGSLPQSIKAMAPVEVFASKMGAKALTNHFHMDHKINVVSDGQTLDLGDMKMTFIETRMCHWPDSMVTYLHERQLLFSQDIFGMHLAGDERFADELDNKTLDHEAAKYFANILLHLCPFVTKAMKKLKDRQLPLSMVAPDHGPIWRGEADIDRIMNNYAMWSQQQPTNKAIVLYDTMWGSTQRMAAAIGHGLADGGATVKLMSMSSCHRSDVMTELLDAGALVVGSPTINNTIFPTIADVMTYMKGLRPCNLIAAAFGSHGWSGEAPKHLHAMLEEMSLTMAAEPLRINYVPDAAAIASCHEFGKLIARETLSLAM